MGTGDLNDRSEYTTMAAAGAAALAGQGTRAPGYTLLVHHVLRSVGSGNTYVLNCRSMPEYL